MASCDSVWCLSAAIWKGIALFIFIYILFPLLADSTARVNSPSAAVFINLTVKSRARVLSLVAVISQNTQEPQIPLQYQNQGGERTGVVHRKLRFPTI